ncbi:GNAT family N-acetyltransferase [Alkalihalophilus pseudofirmus]|uniref:GNAT family N-acetyltransferase n=1 Tax=Alkalihalophilus pseudofirmus TaxID=79885 RepID=A0AAJ2NRG0_ALKPS|nr:GNAT family N-acetyltransferase [Alkalihalophilus pseudofirmus]MDV2886957.1 GNAT family N-acetyltransferase [Alkalihalophilus pseudofirmus]WEG16856.1 GNAT family N-acetyltransferase [Alkalihalophilus pseudofirmus]
MSKLNIRPYTLEDYEGLLDVQKEAFPPPFPEELWWSKEQIRSHVETFPKGALVAEIDGVIVGSATSLIIQYTGEPHTWDEVSDKGFIRRSHNPHGDSLYGIDVCVRPSYRGRGIAGALYEARKEVVEELELTRFLAGCRVPNYHEYAQHLDIDSYIKKVHSGEIHDLVLSFMIKQGLTPLQALPNYLDDDESLDYAVLVEWQNKL